MLLCLLLYFSKQKKKMHGDHDGWLAEL